MDQVVSPAVAESTNHPISWLEVEITKLDQEYQELLQTVLPWPSAPQSNARRQVWGC